VDLENKPGHAYLIGQPLVRFRPDCALIKQDTSVTYSSVEGFMIPPVIYFITSRIVFLYAPSFDLASGLPHTTTIDSVGLSRTTQLS
jgi:hypothetical protein